MFDLTSTPRPQPGDDPFGEGADWWHNACISPFERDHYGRATGFHMGADALVQRVVDKRADQDWLVFPIVFCYRHYLELLLKDIIAAAAALDGETPEGVNGHKLVPL